MPLKWKGMDHVTHITSSDNVPEPMMFLGCRIARPPLYLEAEDDGPDEPQGEAVVPVHDVVGAHVLQVDPLLLQELQSLVHVLQAVDPHAALGGFGLKQQQQHVSVYLRLSKKQEHWTADSPLSASFFIIQ